MRPVKACWKSWTVSAPDAVRSLMETDQRQRVLYAMVELAHQKILLLLGGLALRESTMVMTTPLMRSPAILSGAALTR